jgi:hypothetical protein
MSFLEKIYKARHLVPCLVLIVFIVWVMVIGWATATEAAAYGVLGALVIAWRSGGLNRESFRASLMGATRLSCMIMFILAGASFLSSCMAFTGIPRALEAAPEEGFELAEIAGGYDAWFAHYDNAGFQTWIRQLGTPWWDQAFALTLGRESANPRPAYYKTIQNYFGPYTSGFISYSDGVHDDVNKTVWSRLGWEPGTQPCDIVLEYTRCFFGGEVAEQGDRALRRLAEVVARVRQPFDRRSIDARGHLRTEPHVHGLEAFFGAVLERRKV